MKRRFIPLLTLIALITAAACSPAAVTPTSQPASNSVDSTPTQESLGAPAATATTSQPTSVPAAAASSGTGGIAQQAVASCKDVTDPNINMPANSSQQQFAAPEQVIENSHSYCAIFTTEHGRFVVQLYPQNAPANVNNFVFLASKGFYDNMGFHRVISGFMAQTGDPTGTGRGGPGYNNIPLEASGPLKYDKAGVVGVARSNNPNSAGSQFFITFAAASFLDNQYTILGEVVSGIDVVNQIRLRDMDSDPNAGSITPEKLVSVRVVDIGAK